MDEYDETDEMTTTDLVEVLREALQSHAETEDLDLYSYTYEQAGVMTTDAGLVVSVDGTEFQVTVVRSR